MEREKWLFIQHNSDGKPCAWGLSTYGDITPERAHEWHVPSDCPLEHTESALGVIHHMTRIQPVTLPMFGPERPWFRLVCTCGHVGTEHPIEQAVAMDVAKHLASVDSAPYVEGQA